MATYGKPTTSFYVNYGNLSPLVAQRALAPVLIAPRYALHRVGVDSTEKTKLTTFPIVGDNSTVFTWPEKADNSVVDAEGVQVFAKNSWWKYNTTSLSGKIVGVNCIELDDTVQYVANTNGELELCESLQGVELLPGDKVTITTTVSEGTQEVVEGVVVGVEGDLGSAVVTTTPASSQVSTTGIKVTGDKFKTETTVSYLVTVTSVSADSRSATAEVLALLGDTGYSEIIDINTETGVALGELGLSVMLGTGAKKDDSYIVSATPAKVSRYSRVYISKNLEEYYTTDTEGKPTQNITVDFATDRLSAPLTKLSTADWDIHAGGVSIAETVRHTQDKLSLELYEAELHVDYRELLLDDRMELRTNQTADISDWVGPIHPDNPMGMMYAACGQEPGAFFYLAATDNSVDNTVRTVNYVSQFEAVYSFVPYMQTPEVQQAVTSAIAKYADPQVAQFKHAWFCTDSNASSVIYQYDDEQAALVGSIKADGVLTLLGKSVDVISGGVLPGDIVTVSRGTAGTKEYVVDKLRGKNEIVLKNAELTGVSCVSFRRILNSSEYAKKLAAMARSINNRCINFVVSDSISFAGFDNVSKTYLCAALAGMRSALAPHAPMNELVVPGFTIHDTLKWTDEDYDVMNGGGCWVVAPNAEGDVVTYHQITTLTNGTIAEEDSVVSNGDELVRRLRLAVRPYASGKSNVSNALINTLRKVLVAELTQLQADYYPEIYGPRILGYTIEQLYIPEGNKSSIVCSLRLSLPQPMQDGVFNFNLF